MPIPVTHERIAIRAYEIWQKREEDGTPGTAEHDWFLAERELQDDNEDD
jgi:hypothetical protein